MILKNIFAVVLTAFFVLSLSVLEFKTMSVNAEYMYECPDDKWFGEYGGRWDASSATGRFLNWRESRTCGKCDHSARGGYYDYCLKSETEARCSGNNTYQTKTTTWDRHGGWHSYGWSIRFGTNDPNICS